MAAGDEYELWELTDSKQLYFIVNFSGSIQMAYYGGSLDVANIKDDKAQCPNSFKY